jgi:hypothetical protein
MLVYHPSYHLRLNYTELQLTPKIVTIAGLEANFVNETNLNYQQDT